MTEKRKITPEDIDLLVDLTTKYTRVADTIQTLGNCCVYEGTTKEYWSLRDELNRLYSELQNQRTKVMLAVADAFYPKPKGYAHEE